MSSHIKTENHKNTPLQKKLARMHLLQDNMPQYKDMLNLFELIIKEREKYKAKLSSAIDLHDIQDPVYYDLKLQKGLPLLVKNDIKFDNALMTAYFTALLSIVKTKSNHSVEHIEALINQKEKLNFETLFNEYLHNESSLPRNTLLEFLINQTLNLVLETYADHLKHHIKFDKWENGFCPVCGEHPAMAALKVDTGERILICPACASEWHFQRTKCPFCKNQDQQQLSYLFVENDDKYRIELCDECRQYLKTIDLRKVTPNIITDIDYEIENIVTLHLDIIARDKGFINNHPDDSSSAVTQFDN
ncbi:MAG: formate dehydrogenase accessory protein FdhE [Desulfobacteraceae bacterium]|nr:formate dehydrogenase accessory protein FdhE [Desulfobacteraceae bacterium]MBC2756110.1 formate dehydrogenase accessory protein FdhE [Desulfobacteraceae bacterium]MBC2763733.1 formate dehydrogenase accessory protein FdhE [ANME-2 cluster archaeon]